MITIFIVQLVTNSATSIFLPIIKHRYYEYQSGSVDDSLQSACEQESELELCPESAFDEWQALTIQYGYVTMFVVAFPLAPLIGLLSNVFTNYAYSIKYCKLRTRPIPFGAEGIGAWYTVFELLSYFAVVTNISLICFQTTQLDLLVKLNLSSTEILWVAVFMEHILFFIKYLIAEAVPDLSGPMSHLKLRNEYLVLILN